jgi:hypothetical protein
MLEIPIGIEYITKMKFKIRKLNYFKRRIPEKEIQGVSVKFRGLKLKDNHTCVMIITYDDGNTHELTGRVNLNDIKGTWSVAGSNPHGQLTMVDIIT